jgi:hypothetical protein
MKILCLVVGLVGVAGIVLTVGMGISAVAGSILIGASLIAWAIHEKRP